MQRVYDGVGIADAVHRFEPLDKDWAIRVPMLGMGFFRKMKVYPEVPRTEVLFRRASNF